MQAALSIWQSNAFKPPLGRDATFDLRFSARQTVENYHMHGMCSLKVKMCYIYRSYI